jgi:hypothetical protein
VLDGAHNVAVSDMRVAEHVTVVDAELHASIFECILTIRHHLDWPTPALDIVGDVVSSSNRLLVT